MKNASPPKSPAMKPMNTTSAPSVPRGPMVPPSTKGHKIGVQSTGHGHKIGTIRNDRDVKGAR